jgi:putative RNA 2'-phosphotransferase
VSVRESKFLSLVLRHQPSKIGIQLDPAGWVDVEVLLAACAAHGMPLSREDLDRIVATNDKRRFALSDDGRRIRASQGHSVGVELGYRASAPPEVLFHGTVAEALPAIGVEGLRPMNRHAVHLSRDEATASKVGSRRGRAIVLRVRAGEMHRAGHAFTVAANGVWLVDHVPAEFLELPDQAPRAPRLSHGRDRKAIAHDTVAACDAGAYRNRAGVLVDLAPRIADAANGTRVVDKGALKTTAIPADRAMTIDVSDESTVEAILRLAPTPGLGVLNFASAKNPGGGFLGGAQAQEESLARASALYPCLLTCNADYYAANRAHASALYLDLAIISPDVPFFRDDTGAWLPAPVLATVITCAAPNASALRQQRSPELDDVPDVLRRRAELVLRAACEAELRTLVLGAWGAGVFGNDPALVADAFAAPLSGLYRGAFDRVVFAILDDRPGEPVLTAFRARFR